MISLIHSLQPIRFTFTFQMISVQFQALYLDGTVYVPQELAHLQDLIIEKQLRIYAMPEELEILRNFDEPQE